MSKQPSRAVNLEQSTGRYFRLKQELAIAYGAVPWNSGRLDRLTNELAATECEIAALVAMRDGTDTAPAPRRSTQSAP